MALADYIEAELRPVEELINLEVEMRAGLAPDDEYRLAAERAQAAMIKIRERIEFEFG